MAHSPVGNGRDDHKELLLAGDLGATNARLGIFSPRDGLTEPLTRSTLATADHPSAAALAKAFLAQAGSAVDRAVFALAGPVIDGRVTAGISHLPWDVDKNSLQQELGLETMELINDVEAMARAVPALTPEDLHTLSEGRPAPTGTTAVIAPGTGLGQAFNIWDRTGWRTCASEGGQASFAPTNDFEIELLQHIQQMCKHVSSEMVCSGMGIPRIYECLKENHCLEEPTWLAEQLAEARDPTAVIFEAALSYEKTCELAIATLDRFTAILGAEAANLALKVMATGGVYLAGGIPRRILPFLEQKQFLRAFGSKGIMTDILLNIPIHVITNPDVGLIGAASCLL